MISLIIPTIGTGNRLFLEEAIQSALGTSKSLVSEVLVIDNSHLDDFSKYLSELVSGLNDQRFRIVTTPKMLSMGDNWNYGLENISNPWHLYLHDDDILNLDVFNKIKLDSFNDEGFVSYNFHEYKNSNATLTKRNSGIEGILENTPKFISTIYNTEKLKTIKGWDPKAGHALDLLCLFELHCKFGSLHIPESLGKYRIHNENASSKEKRAIGYGNQVPYVINQCFELSEDPVIRRELLFHLCSFTYPNQTILKRGINFILRKFGLNAWFK